MEYNKKRPVHVTTTRWSDGRRGDNKKFKHLVLPGFVPLEYDGIFHGFGTDIEISNDNEFGKQTIAIVEDESGQVHTVHPNHIQFTDK